jgi:protocatechuate 3,4-dioxygenase beta subunit
MFKAKATPSQTIGPFFHGATRWLVDLAVPRGDNVVVAGQVLDMDAKPVSDALLEVSQPASEESGLRFQRIVTDDDGRFQFRMPKPSSAPLYADVTTFARGLLKRVLTRVYIATTCNPTNHSRSASFNSGCAT